MGKLESLVATLLLVLFVVSITSTVVTASNADFNKGYKEGCNLGYCDGFKDSQSGNTSCVLKAFEYKPKVTDYKRGYTQGYNDCYPKGCNKSSEYIG